MKSDHPPTPRLTLHGEIPIGLASLFEASESTLPEFLRLPRPRTRCPVTGLSRTTLEELIREGFIPAKKLRRPGRTRCITLIPRRQLIDYVLSLPESAGTPKTQSSTTEGET